MAGFLLNQRSEELSEALLEPGWTPDESDQSAAQVLVASLRNLASVMTFISTALGQPTEISKSQTSSESCTKHNKLAASSSEVEKCGPTGIERACRCPSLVVPGRH